MYPPSQRLRLVAIAATFIAVMCVFPSCNRRADVADQPPTPSETASPPGVPRLAVDEARFDFGLVEPVGSVKHVFRVRNAGDGPLKILKVHKSCNCVLDELPLRILAPGESMEVTVAIQLKGRQGPFEDTVTVRTNDPENEMTKLSLRGKAGWVLNAEPSRLVWQNITRRTTKRAEILLYSQTWDAFEVDRVATSSEAVQYELAPAAADRLADVGAKAGYLVRLTLASKKLPTGDLRVNESIQFTGRSGGHTTESQSALVKIDGTLKKHVSIHGPGLTPRNTLALGTLAPGKGAHRRLIMQVFDRRRDLAVERIESYPDYLKVAVKPLSSGKGKAGLYAIDVDVPPNAPPANHLGEDPAWFKIVTAHPAISEIRLPVEFAIVNP